MGTIYVFANINIKLLFVCTKNQKCKHIGEIWEFANISTADHGDTTSSTQTSSLSILFVASTVL